MYKMLDNNFVLSILISSISTLFIHIANKKDENREIPINKNEIIKIFGIIFIVCNAFFFLKKNKMSGGGNMSSINLPSGENLLTHSSRPPF